MRPPEAKRRGPFFETLRGRGKSPASVVLSLLDAGPYSPTLIRLWTASHSSSADATAMLRRYLPAAPEDSRSRMEWSSASLTRHTPPPRIPARRASMAVGTAPAHRDSSPKSMTPTIRDVAQNRWGTPKKTTSATRAMRDSAARVGMSRGGRITLGTKARAIWAARPARSSTAVRHSVREQTAVRSRRNIFTKEG